MVKIMVALGLCVAAVVTYAQDPKAVSLSQAQALSEFPALGQPDSNFNKRFVEKFNSLKSAGDSLLKRDDWPEALAKQVGAEFGLAPVIPAKASPTPTNEEKIQAIKERMAAQRKAQSEKAYQDTLRRENEGREEVRLEENLQKICFGVEAQTDLLRDKEIEGLVTVGNYSPQTESQGLNQVQVPMYEFSDAFFYPGKSGEESVHWFEHEDTYIQNAQIWAVIQDFDTAGLLSNQKICLEVYEIGTVVEGERRYRKFTASKKKAIEFLKSSNAGQ